MQCNIQYLGFKGPQRSRYLLPFVYMTLFFFFCTDEPQPISNFLRNYGAFLAIRHSLLHCRENLQSAANPEADRLSWLLQQDH